MSSSSAQPTASFTWIPVFGAFLAGSSCPRQGAGKAPGEKMPGDKRHPDRCLESAQRWSAESFTQQLGCAESLQSL